MTTSYVTPVCVKDELEDNSFLLIRKHNLLCNTSLIPGGCFNITDTLKMAYTTVPLEAKNDESHDAVALGYIQNKEMMHNPILLNI